MNRVSLRKNCLLTIGLLMALAGSCLAAHTNTKDLPNFDTVGPGIYRGAAPTVAGLQKLKAQGIHTIIDLRIAPKTVAKEKAIAQQLGFQWINLPMGSDAPTKKEVATLIATLKLAPIQPVFVHCQHGADRTGCMIGIWRVTQQGWTYQQALTEMRKYGFNPRWHNLSHAVEERS
jgi:protein tyrosine/serine phosphatase